MITPDRKYLFVSGTARSGTTLVTRTLNAHPSVCVATERYNRLWKNEEVTPAHFEEARFRDLRAGDAGLGSTRSTLALDMATRLSSAAFVGDKFPSLWQHLDYVFETFANAHVIHILRNPWSVARSHQVRFDDPDDRFHISGQRSVKQWNRAQRTTLEALRDGARITVVSYEKLFASRANLARLFDVLGLDVAQCDQDQLSKDEARFRASLMKQEPRDELLSAYVASHAYLGAYRELANKYCIFAQPAKDAQPQSNEVFA